MKYVLDEKEYVELIHKDRVRAPVDEFIKDLTKTAELNAGFGNNMLLLPVDRFRDLIETLRIKLDL